MIKKNIQKHIYTNKHAQVRLNRFRHHILYFIFTYRFALVVTRAVKVAKRPTRVTALGSID